MGAFDDLIPGAAPPTAAAPARSGAFDDLIPAAGPQPTLGERFVTNAKEALASNPAPAVERYLSMKGGELLAPLLGEDNFLARHSDELMQRRREIGAEYEAMPSYTEQPTTLGKILHGATALSGQLAGSAADPSSLLAPGATAFGRIAGNAAVNAGTDVVGQVADMGTGLREEFSPAQTAISAGGGAAFQGVSEGLSALFSRIAARRGKPAADLTDDEILDEIAQDPELEAALMDAGYTPEAARAADPEVAQRFVDRRAAREAEDALRSNRPVDSVISGDSIPRRTKDGRRPTPEEADLVRQQGIQEGIVEGEMDPGVDPRAGQRPRQSAEPFIVDEMGRASAPGDVGARAGLEANGGVHAMSSDDLDELLIRNGHRMADVRNMPPGQKIRAAERITQDAARQPEGPTMSVRSEQPDAGPGQPAGDFSPVDRPAFSGQPNSARPDPNTADVSRAPNERPRESFVTGGTGDRPYVDDPRDPNAGFWRQRAERMAEQERAKVAAEQDVRWAEQDDTARGQQTEEPGPEARAQDPPPNAEPPPARGPGGPQRTEAPQPEPRARPEPSPGPDGRARSYGRTSGLDDIMADFMRRRTDEAAADDAAARGGDDGPAPGLGRPDEPEPNAGRAQQDEPEFEEFGPDFKGRGDDGEEYRSDQEEFDPDAGKRAGPDPEPPPGARQGGPDPRAKWSKAKTKGERNRFDELADEADQWADEHDANGNAESARWWREHAAHNRANADRRRKWKAEQDEQARKWSKGFQDREQRSRGRQEREQWWRQNEGRQRHQNNWQRGDGSWHRERQSGFGSFNQGRPSDSKSSDPFHNKPTSSSAAPGADGRYATGTDGVVASDRGGPISFPDQKAAARWIMKEGHAKSPDQIFELANHPTKGGEFTVRERGRAQAKPSGRDAPGATFYSNPVGPALLALWDAAKWAGGKIAGMSPGIRDLGAFADEIGRAAKRGDGPGAISSLFSAARRTYDGHMEWLAGHFDSPHLDALLDNFITAPGRGDRAVSKTFDEAIQQRVNPRLKAWQGLVEEARATGLSDDAIADQLAGVKPLTAKGAAVVRKIQAFFAEEHAYATGAGVEMGKSKNYFPRIFDVEKVRTDRVQALAALEKVYRAEGLGAKEAKDAALNLWEAVVYGDVATPAMGGASRSVVPSIFKSREFGPRADAILRDFYVRDLDAVGVRYVPAIARRVEVAKRFGDGFSKWKELIKEIRADDPKILGYEKEIASYVATMTGFAAPQMGHGARAVSSWLRTFTTLSLMEKATLSSLVEPLVAGIRTGNLLDSFGTFRETAKQLSGKFKGMAAQDVRDIAIDLGVIAGEGHNALMAARFNAVEELGRRQAKVLSAYFRRTGLEQWTNASRVATMRTGMVFLRRLAHDMAAGGDKARMATFSLRELGIEDAKGFSSMVRGWGDQLPDHGQLFRPEAAAYRNALLRFSDQSILRPTAGTRPRWANHPLGAIAFQLNSYAYAYGRNVLVRQARLAKAAKAGEIPAGLYAQQLLAGALPGFLALALGQYAFGEVRDQLYSIGQDDPAHERMTGQAKVERALSRSGLFSGYDQWLQALSGVRYQSSPLAPALGPILGNVGEVATAAARALISNSPDTNSAERKAATVAYDTLIEPTVNLALGSFAPGAANSALTTLVLPNLRSKWVDAAAGPESARKKDEIKGLFEHLAQRWAGMGEGGGGGVAGRPKRPKRPSRN